MKRCVDVPQLKTKVINADVLHELKVNLQNDKLALLILARGKEKLVNALLNSSIIH